MEKPEIVGVVKKKPGVGVAEENVDVVDAEGNSMPGIVVVDKMPDVVAVEKSGVVAVEKPGVAL